MGHSGIPFKEIVGRIKQDDQSVPLLDNGYYYYTRYEEGKEYPIHCRKKGSLDAEEEVMLNVNEMAEGYSYFAVGGRSVSTNNNLLAFSVDTVSRREYTLQFKDLTTGEILDDRIPNISGGYVGQRQPHGILHQERPGYPALLPHLQARFGHRCHRRRTGLRRSR